MSAAVTGPPAAIGATVRRRRRRPKLLGIFVWGYIIWSLGPALIAIAFSFNDGRSRSVWQGLSLRWWTYDPGSLIHNSVFESALRQSFTLAVLNVLIAVPLGVGLAIALSRWFGRGSSVLGLLATVSLVVPELVLAISLFLLFTQLLSFVELGTQAQLIGQVTFTLPFVVVITRGRLASIPTDLEEAAMDLGASPLHALRLVLLPLLGPALIASVVIAFALSIDDFVVTQYLSSTAASQTVPMLIFNTARGSATPALNATATVMVLITALLVTVGAIFYYLLSRRQRPASVE